MHYTKVETVEISNIFFDYDLCRWSIRWNRGGRFLQGYPFCLLAHERKDQRVDAARFFFEMQREKTGKRDDRLYIGQAMNRRSVRS